MAGRQSNLFQDGEVTGYNPDQNGDYRTIDDLQYDYNHVVGKLIDVLTAISNNNDKEFFILYGGEVTDSGLSQVDISAGVAIGKNENGDVRVCEIPALTNIDIPSGWNDDRQIWCVGYHEWTLNAATRAHATTGETYHQYLDDGYKGQDDSDDLFVDSDPNNGSENVLCWGSFQISGGGVFNSLDTGERTRDYGMSFTDLEADTLTERTSGNGIDIEGIHFEDSGINDTYYVNSQADFDNIIEEVAANQWQFIDSVTSVVFNYLAGGYQMDDDNDYLETNNCLSFEMRGGAYLDFNAGNGYVKVNTVGCYLKNVDVQGNGSAGAPPFSFWSNSGFITFDGCKTSNRNTTTVFSAFKGASALADRATTRYINCTASSMTQSAGAVNIHIFDQCNNLSGCTASGIDHNGNTGNIIAFLNCDNITNCTALDLDKTNAGGIYGFYQCENISNCLGTDFDSTGGLIYGFSDCLQMTSCQATDLAAASTFNCIAFYNCEQMSACLAKQIDTTGTGEAHGFNLCQQLSGCKAEDIDTTSGTCYGFLTCDNISGCIATDVQSAVNNATYGFSGCTQLSGCEAKQIDGTGTGAAIGFDHCNQLSGCIAEDIDSVNSSARGYDTCFQMSACEARDIESTSSCYGFNSCQRMSGCHATGITSTGGTTVGFQTCKWLSGCMTATLNSTTSNCYAFNGTDGISACRAFGCTAGGTVRGFINCSFISAAKDDVGNPSGNTVQDDIANQYSCDNI